MKLNTILLITSLASSITLNSVTGIYEYEMSKKHKAITKISKRKTIKLT